MVMSVENIVKHSFSNGTCAKETHIPKGEFFIAPKNKDDYMCILAFGKVILYTDTSSNKQEYTYPSCITIKANKKHLIESLRYSVLYCIHATDETDINKVDHVVIAKGV